MTATTIAAARWRACRCRTAFRRAASLASWRSRVRLFDMGSPRLAGSNGLSPRTRRHSRPSRMSVSLTRARSKPQRRMASTRMAAPAGMTSSRPGAMVGMARRSSVVMSVSSPATRSASASESHVRCSRSGSYSGSAKAMAWMVVGVPATPISVAARPTSTDCSSRSRWRTISSWTASRSSGEGRVAADEPLGEPDAPHVGRHGLLGRVRARAEDSLGAAAADVQDQPRGHGVGPARVVCEAVRRAQERDARLVLPRQHLHRLAGPPQHRAVEVGAVRRRRGRRWWPTGGCA